MDSDRSVPIKKSKFDLFFFLGISYLLIMAFLIAAPTKTITEKIEVSYLEKETYYVQESYQDTEYTKNVEDASYGMYFTRCGTGCSCSHYGYNSLKIPSSYCDQCTCTDSKLVTKYKEVPKVRDVTKIRIEPRAAEVNWVIGFKTPYKLHFPLT